MSGSLEIVSSNGASRRYPLTERMTLGSAAPANVIVDGEPGLLSEHVLFAPQGRTCWVSVVDGAQVAVTLDGQPFASGHVPWGSELRLGNTALRLHPVAGDTDLVASADPAGAGAESVEAATSQESTSPVLLIALLGALGWVGFMFIADDGAVASQAPSAEPPALFAGAADCPDSDRAFYRAQVLAEEGAAKAERYPFAASDGVRAAELFALSEACFRAAGRSSEAEQVAAEGRQIREQVTNDFATQRFTLERALESDDLAGAERAASALIKLTAHIADSSYATQLRDLRRRIVLARRAQFDE